MRRIGIVSLYDGENFGNKLQNYALQETIENFGFISETFKYEICKKKPVLHRTRKLSYRYIISYFHSKLLGVQIRSEDRLLVSRLLYFIRNKESLLKLKQVRRKTFEEFDVESLRFAERLISLNEQIPDWTDDYSTFICGSDQVWNPHYASTSPITFLQFAPEEKRIAYAPSFGVSELPEECRKDFTKWVNEIPFLSVREEAGAKLIEKMGRQAQVLADPTMLLTASEWKAFARAPIDAPAPGSYILGYFLGRKTRAYCHTIRKLSKERQLAEINLFDALSPQYQNIGPREFIWLIQNSAIVCTDSFHATVFSILFHKNFAVFKRVEGKHSMSSRIVSLLDKFGIEYISGDVFFCHPIDDADEVIDREREKAFRFLKNALKVNGI